MFLLDSMLVGGLKFVLGRVADAVDAEMNDVERMREELLAAQMQLELGEIDEDEFTRIEASILERLRAIEEARRAAAESHEPSEQRFTIDASFEREDGDGREHGRG